MQSGFRDGERAAGGRQAPLVNRGSAGREGGRTRANAGGERRVIARGAPLAAGLVLRAFVFVGGRQRVLLYRCWRGGLVGGGGSVGRSRNALGGVGFHAASHREDGQATILG